MDHYALVRALKHGWPGANFTLRGTDLATVEWRGPGAKPAWAEIEAAWAEIAGVPQSKPAIEPTDTERIAALEARLAALDSR